MIMINIFSTFVIGVTGGFIFYLLHLSLPWILGPALAVMLVNSFRPEIIKWPRWIFKLGIIIIAYLLGQKLTMDLAKNMLYDLPWMVLSALFWLFISLAIGYYFSKIANINLSTAILGSVPGGLSQMVLIADEIKSVDPGTVAIIQTARVVVVLYTVPFLAAAFVLPLEAPGFITIDQHLGSPSIWGYLALPLVFIAGWMARRIHMPGGEFLLAFLLVSLFSVFGFVWPAVPNLVLALAQLVLGIFLGSIVQPKMFITNKKLGPLAIGTSIALVGIAATASWILSNLTPDSMITWFLALAPGGLNEMALVALGLDADVIKVTSFQIVRLLFILFAAPPILKAIIKYAERA